jgi:hypothetical protein
LNVIGKKGPKTAKYRISVKSRKKAQKLLSQPSAVSFAFGQRQKSSLSFEGPKN